MRGARVVVAVATAFVAVFGGFGLLVADAANPSGFVAVVNPLSQVPVEGELYDASCPSASSCVAVGLSGGRIPFVLVGDPSNWDLAQAHAITLDTGTYVGSNIWSV